jgi:hypothetical protein
MPEGFEESLDKLVSEHLKGGCDIGSIISALELKLMALREEEIEE